MAKAKDQMEPKKSSSNKRGKRPRMKANAREKKFCKLYLECSRYGEAYMGAGFDCSEISAPALGLRLFRTPRVQAYWREIIAPIEKDNLVSASNIILEIREIAFSHTAGDMARLRALKLLAQIKGMLIQVQDVRHSGHINTVDMSKLSTEELKALAALNAQI